MELAETTGVAARVVQRVQSLPCVGQDAKTHTCLWACTEATSQQLDDFVNDRLKFLEQHIACFSDPEMESVWRRQATGGVPIGAPPRMWLRAAAEQPRDVPSVLYCIANYVLLNDGTSPEDELLARDLLADALRTGHPASASAALEPLLGLSPGAYEPQALRDALHKTIPRYGPARLLSAYGTLADALFRQGRLSDAANLLEAYFGIRAGEYGTEGFCDALRQSFASLPPMLVSRPVRVLADVLSGLCRFSDAVLLLEGFLGLVPGAYCPENLRPRLDVFSQHVSYNNVLSSLASLADSLRHMGRHRDALALLEAWFGLTPADYIPETIRERIRSDERIQAINAASAVTRLSRLLRYSGRAAHARILLETCFFPDGDSSRPRANLFAHLENLDQVAAQALLQEFAIVLEFEAGPAEALARWGSFLRLKPQDYTPCDLMSSIDRLIGSRDQNNATVIASVVANLLVETDRGHDGVVLLEVSLGLRDLADHPGVPAYHSDSAAAADLPYREKIVSNRLRDRTRTVLPTVVARAIKMLIRALLKVRRSADARVLLRAWWREYDERQYWKSLFPEEVLSFFALWLELCGHENWPATQSLCQGMMTYLRTNLRHSHTSFEDRVRLLQQLGQLRQELWRTVSVHASSTRSETAVNPIHLQAYLWDQELGQRLLIEQLIVGESQTADISSWPTGESPTPDWPFRDELNSATSDSALQLFARQGDSRRPISQPVPEERVEPRASRTWHEIADRLLEQGLDAASLTKILGGETVLLRIGLQPNGGIFWMAIVAAADGLKVISSGPRATNIDDEGCARVAIARHAIRMRLALGDEHEYLRWFESKRDKLLAIRQHLASHDICAQFDGLEMLLLDFAGRGQVDLGAVSASAWEGILQTFLWSGPQHEQTAVFRPGEPHESAGHWRLLIDDLFQAANTGVNAQDATRELVQELGDLCEFESLRNHLHSDRTRLVIQATDGLQAVPWSHVLLAGNPLFQHVLAIRHSLSLLVDTLQSEVKSSQETGAQDNVFVASWFDPTKTESWFDARELHRRLKDLGLRYYGVAEAPQASASTVISGLQQRDYVAAVILAHGSRGGLILAPEGDNRDSRQWNGEGGNLGGVELFVIASCSLGRLEENANRDWDGFCAKQVASGARSQLACLWPVKPAESVDFACNVVENYIRLRTANSRDDGAWLRAEALNAAYRRCCGSSAIGMDTVAAFQLWGLG